MTQPTDPAKALKLALKRIERDIALVRQLVADGAPLGSVPVASSKAELVSASPFPGKHDLLIEELKRSGCSSVVLKAYIGKVVAQIGVPKNPRALFVELCTKLAQYPESVLAMAAERTISTRSKISAPKQVYDDVNHVLPRAQIRLTPQSPGWKAWIIHLQASGEQGKRQAQFFENQGMMFQLSEYPSGHWAQQQGQEVAA